MNLNKVDLNLFIVFDAIYTEANLTRAGQIVGITQPAVSNALARLRETFNDPLFVRTAQGMVPTPMAQKAELRLVLEAVRGASLAAHSAAGSACSSKRRDVARLLRSAGACCRGAAALVSAELILPMGLAADGVNARVPHPAVFVLDVFDAGVAVLSEAHARAARGCKTRRRRKRRPTVLAADQTVSKMVVDGSAPCASESGASIPAIIS